ncbi:hypothetical protein VNO80_19096 [Phaseolus coccineus]|uniref:Uncharacterized protein n=1 Tax=Phaseolus coccineus TaxID=3886 RepID=A0AAN9QX08_PHACN
MSYRRRRYGWDMRDGVPTIIVRQGDVDIMSISRRSDEEVVTIDPHPEPQAKIWAMEHFFSYKRQVPRSGNKYPRIMHWMDVRVGDHELRHGFCKNKVVIELCASNEELCSEFVQEVLYLEQVVEVLLLDDKQEVNP